MAILSKYLIASSVFSIAALAAPLVQRDLVTDVVIETVWTTVDATTTIYDNAPPQVPATSTPAIITTSAMQMITVPTTSSTPPPPPPPSTTLVPMTTSPAAAAAAASTPASSSAPAAQFFTTSATAASGLAEAVTSATMSSTSSLAAPAAPSSSAAPVGSSSSSSSGSVPAGSTTGTCEGSGMPCVGDVTYWDGGLGACGTVVDTDTDLAIALPFEFMGTLSNTNPYCGRSVTLYNPTSGTTVQAVVADKCMGCVDRAIDCTNILFNQITDNLGNGRESGIEWWLN